MFSLVEGLCEKVNVIISYDFELTLILSSWCGIELFILFFTCLFYALPSGI